MTKQIQISTDLSPHEYGYAHPRRYALRYDPVHELHPERDDLGDGKHEGQGPDHADADLRRERCLYWLLKIPIKSIIDRLLSEKKGTT